jgi:hypothetical protein
MKKTGVKLEDFPFWLVHNEVIPKRPCLWYILDLTINSDHRIGKHIIVIKNKK